MFLQIPCSRNQKQDLVIQYNSVSSEFGKASGSGKKKKYISQERHGIGKYDAEHSNNAAINKKSTVHAFNSNYHVEFKDGTFKKRCSKKILNIKKRRRSILLKKLNKKIQKHLIVTGNCWALINTDMIIARANEF